MKSNCTKLERYNGTAWEVVSEKFSMTSPELTREAIEDDAVLDCPTGATDNFNEKSLGSKEIGDFEVEVKYNIVEDGAKNTEKHFLLEDDFDTNTAALWRQSFPNTDKTGILIHATVKTVGALNIAPNETLRRSFTLQPTGKHYSKVDDITNATLPTGLGAPVANYGSN